MSDFELQPHLVGELIELRPLQPDDWEDLFAAASDPMIWEQHPAHNRYKEKVFKEYFAGALESGGAFVAIDRKTGKIVGSSRYLAHHPEKREIEIGWTFLDRSHWGGVYNGELKRLMLDHAFQFVDTVVFVIGAQNLRSQKAVEKIGGVMRGRRNVDYGDTILENVVYELKKPAPKKEHMANIDTELIAYLKTVDTATLANAIELLTLRPRAEGYASLDLKCLFPEFGPMCGYAVTAQAETVTLGSPKSEEAFVELFEAVEASPKPAVVVMQEIGGDRDRATHAGEVMATIFTRLGAIGLVSDCGVRDLTAVRKIGFHYFARGAVASHANYRIVRTGTPVEITGVTIRPGDMVHADENGLITVPESGRERLHDLVDQILGRERTLLDLVRGGEFTAAQLRGRFFH